MSEQELFDLLLVSGAIGWILGALSVVVTSRL